MQKIIESIQRVFKVNYDKVSESEKLRIQHERLMTPHYAHQPSQWR